MTLKIDQVVLRLVELELSHPFTTSFTSVTKKVHPIVEFHSDGLIGYGECPTLSVPFYNEETSSGAYELIRNILLPLLQEQIRVDGGLKGPETALRAFAPVRRNAFARSAVEGALWDLKAKALGVSLSHLLGGVKTAVDSGISIGIQKDIPTLLAVIDQNLKQGYQRIKIKIKPGKDLDYVRAVREKYPRIPLTVDANSAYRLSDLPTLKKLDDFSLLFIEQPLAHDDILDHSHLQAELKTPLCLDESIDSLEDLRQALELKSGRVINIKVPRVGGLTEAKKIHDYAQQHGVGVWCGGMLDGGISMAHNIAVASLPNFIYANDINPVKTYFKENFLTEDFIRDANSQIPVPTGPGIGVNIDQKVFERLTVKKELFSWS